ncbi:hypothetical protein XENOCAPTIV_010883, partial [Xenoophorus captivus]
TLEAEELRKQYISPPVAREGVPLIYPEPGQPWIGRRIDYILYRETSISKLCLSMFSKARCHRRPVELSSCQQHWRQGASPR